MSSPQTSSGSDGDSPPPQVHRASTQALNQPSISRSYHPWLANHSGRPVEKCGQPEVYTLWQKPKADRHFQSLLKNNRVMTIRPSDTGTDFGVVGFSEKKAARYLAFAKSLKRFEGQRIVGIDWSLVRP